VLLKPLAAGFGAQLNIIAQTPAQLSAQLRAVGIVTQAQRLPVGFQLRLQTAALPQPAQPRANAPLVALIKLVISAQLGFGQPINTADTVQPGTTKSHMNKAVQFSLPTIKTIQTPADTPGNRPLKKRPVTQR